MGRPKLLLPLPDGRPVLKASVEAVLAAGVDDVVVVLGCEAETVGRAVAELPVRTVLNPRYAEGQSTSVRAGLDALRPATAGALIALGDQPLADPQVIRRVVAAYRTHGRPIVVPRYRDGRGHPVLFAAAVFDELRAVTGDQGGRTVIARDPARVAEVPVDVPIPADVDTWDDYERLRRRDGDG
jgi:molybdenum cofactor cytidylyltransferase